MINFCSNMITNNFMIDTFTFLQLIKIWINMYDSLSHHCLRLDSYSALQIWVMKYQTFSFEEIHCILKCCFQNIIHVLNECINTSAKCADFPIWWQLLQVMECSVTFSVGKIRYCIYIQTVLPCTLSNCSENQCQNTCCRNWSSWMLKWYIFIYW